MAGQDLRRNYAFQADQPRRPYTFTYDGHTSEMECKRCIHQISPGRQCSRRSCFTLPVCWQHLKSVYRLRVGQTTLTDPQHHRLPFRGLFACDATAAANNEPVFEAGDKIVPYVGDRMTQAQLDARYPGEEIAPYAVETEVAYSMPQNRYLLDGANLRGVANLANMCRPSNHARSGCNNNAEIKASNVSGKFPNLVAYAPIMDGDEIFVDYGADYFAPGSIHRPISTNPPGTYGRLSYKPCS